MTTEEITGAAGPGTMPIDAMEEEIGAIARLTDLARAQRAAVARDDIDALDSAGQEMDELLRECSRLRRSRESAKTASHPEAADRLRIGARRFVDELAINRRVLREAIAGVNERATSLYRPTTALYGRPDGARAGGMTP